MRVNRNLSYRYNLSRTDESARMAWITVPEDLTHAEAARLLTVIMATVDLIVAAGGDADTVLGPDEVTDDDLCAEQHAARVAYAKSLGVHRP